MLTFLLNQHPEMFTIGELEGWDFGAAEYKCSCGKLIYECPFFKNMKDVFHENNLSFKMNDFGTKLKLSDNVKINSYLTSALPVVRNSKLEHIRDILLQHLPFTRKKYESAIKSNTIFINTSLKYSDSKVFVDATKNPFRIRFLKNIPDISLYVVYLVRDIRGVVASNVRKKGISVKEAAIHWLRDQEDISRVLSEVHNAFIIYYEELCSNTNPVLNDIYNHVGISDYSFEGDVREGEHHILGNEMRVTNANQIRLDERWKSELSEKQINEIEDIARDYMLNSKNRVSEILSRYINK